MKETQEPRKSKKEFYPILKKLLRRRTKTSTTKNKKNPLSERILKIMQKNVIRIGRISNRILEDLNSLRVFGEALLSQPFADIEVSHR
jgi:hypothetical protein